jgi:carbonic anhydrase/acetyltransferase-like protein (isoleucine patch superfamily)
MTTFAVTNSDQLLPAVNYLLSNLDTQTLSGNITIPGNVLVANTTTGVVSQSGNTTPFAYLYQYVNLRYSNNAVGTDGFDVNSNNYSYFGVFNSSGPTPSSNPASYQWFEVDPPFDLATSRTLYYSAIGGRQIQWAAASSPPSSNYVITVANVAIDLDVVTTAAGTPGERGPVVMAAVITTADPNTATSATLTGWFEASRSNTVAPIGTGLAPVVGDTASFTWAAGAGQPQAAYEYNGSIWIPVSGQVVSGNVIIRGTIAGNAMIANTITATQIAAGTITATQIAANTITAGQIAANTITSNQLAVGTITANRIATGTLTTNLFTANTINGNIMTAGSITADKLAANAITANTVISSGAILLNPASAGFWLDGPSGTARFGNSISIGNQLTVGVNANIGGNLSVGTGATIGNNLTVGNNASIGGNLTVGGLITGGTLNPNTVSTGTIVQSGVTIATSDNTNLGPVYTNPVRGVFYDAGVSTVIPVPNPSTGMYTLVFDLAEFQIFYRGTGIKLTSQILRTSPGGNAVLNNTVINFVATTVANRTQSYTFTTIAFIDTPIPPGVNCTYVRRVAWDRVDGETIPTVSIMGFQNVSITAQLGKR